MLTFGLLSPNKGIEYGLRALPDLLQEFPNLVYIVLGQTHPNLVRDEGEAYAQGLAAASGRPTKLGINTSPSGGAPRETVRSTMAPGRATSPGTGVCSSTMPSGLVPE